MALSHPYGRTRRGGRIHGPASMRVMGTSSVGFQGAVFGPVPLAGIGGVVGEGEGSGDRVADHGEGDGVGDAVYGVGSREAVTASGDRQAVVGSEG